jgi:transmembrane sensor
MTDELLIKFLLKETNEEESITVQNWLDASPSNKTYFIQFEKIWTSSKKLSGSSNVNEDDAWLRFKQRSNDKDKQQPIVSSLRPKYQWLKIAAVLVLVAAAWSVYSLLSPVTYTELAAGNKVSTEILPDGSELTLNKKARISYASNFKRNRSVRLQQGDVFFKVAHDKSHPFIIKVNKVSVLVVGTSFNVKHLKDQTEVIVETGIVKVSLGKDEVVLHKGEKVLIRNGSGKLIKKQNTDQLYNYYRSKVFIANNTPLWRLVEVLNEAYDADIIIKDPSIKNKTLFTTLRTDTTLNYNLEIICQTQTSPNIKLERNQQQIILSNASK